MKTQVLRLKKIKGNKIVQNQILFDYLHSFLSLFTLNVLCVCMRACVRVRTWVRQRKACRNQFSSLSLSISGVSGIQLSLWGTAASSFTS